MKVVLFCGGLGLRLREYPDPVPKPMVPVGYRPMLWHIMRYYAHFGHDDFVVCAIQSVDEADIWINGGYFIFRREIFDYIAPGEELVVEPFQRLVKEEQ